MPTPPVVCQAWFGSETVVRAPHESAGFSGSRMFVVGRPGSTACGPAGERFVLKSFPPGFSRSRAEWVHALMRHLRHEGIAQVPPVIPARGGETVVADTDGTLWELVRFLPGAAVDAPTPAQAADGLDALARLHVAAARFPGEPPRAGPSPGHLRRIEQARRLLSEPWRHRRDRLRRAGADAGDRPWLLDRFDAAIERFESADGPRAVELVAHSRAEPLPLQAVLRDVWSDHLLFVAGGGGPTDGPAFVPPAGGSLLAGIVDYHAAGVDTPATDLARLLGSWRPFAREMGGGPATLLDAWGEAIAAYERVRPLTPDERAAVPFLHATSVILGLDNWFRWTVEERRHFSAPERACARIDRLTAGLGAAIEQTIDAAANLN
jgi:Ser/Thr protein kinase RdoA (MazF antagonist)